MLWKHWNNIMFNGATPSLSRTVQRIREEGRLWAKAGLIKGDVKGFEIEGAAWVGTEFVYIM